jgi:hypothetical protein
MSIKELEKRDLRLLSVDTIKHENKVCPDLLKLRIGCFVALSILIVSCFVG